MPLDHARRTDVHQHLWPVALVEALRARSEPPMLRGWTLHTDGEPPYDVDADQHDPKRRVDLDPDTDVLVSLSTPLGIEALPPDDGRPLLDAWHAGLPELPAPFRGWAALSEVEPDLDGLPALLAAGCVGVQISALGLSGPAALERTAALLERCERIGAPVLVHAGPARPMPGADDWWPAVVDYPTQLQAAWWTWHARGRSSFPRLRLCFTAGAGLAPVQHERFTARGGGRYVVDPDTFVDTSSYGRQGIDALSRVLGIDQLVLGSDRPYAEPADAAIDASLGEAARIAVTRTNPRRLLTGAGP